jgi:hypothetical protein
MTSQQIVHEIERVRQELGRLQDKRIIAATAKDFVESNKLQRKIVELLDELENLDRISKDDPLK